MAPVVAAAAAGRRATCEHCGFEADALGWLSANVESLGDNMVSAVGAKMTMVEISLEREKVHRLRFADCGIPESSHVLWINYSPSDSLLPVEIHVNRPTRQLGRELLLTTVPFPHMDPSTVRGRVTVMIGYVPAEVEPDGALRSLVNATEAYLDGYYTRMVHASQTAVEITLFDFFRKLLLSHHVSKEKLKGFLENDATYARQLTVLLPLVCGLRNQPGMPRDVLGRLERIRSLRNPALHQGAESGLLQPEAARLLTAAIVAVYYVEMLEQKLAEPSQA